jgi:ribonucleoside-diphosphate reductase alpha chain
MWDWHPDVFEFVTVKKDMSRMVGANLSVCISDRFMSAVKNDENWDLVFPETTHPKYKTLWDGDMEKWKKAKLPFKVYKTIKARELWDLICESAWASAEPGLVFMDHANRMSNTWYFEKLVSTNPCGEQPLPPWGVCNLGALNLTSFVKNGEFDYQGLIKAVVTATRFLDNVIDLEHYIFPEMKEKQLSERRVGLGTMGLADALIMMKVRYGSKKSLEVIEKIYQTIRDSAYETSSLLSTEKGMFPKFDKTKYISGKFIQTLPKTLIKKISKSGIRNALLLTQAPTGKTSLLAGVSSGIEPVFAFSYKQKDRLGERTMNHPLYQDYLDTHKDTKEIPDYFVTANDLTPEDHVLVQSVIQKYTDSSISKTVNAPEVHTINDVKKLYTLAYETGCKGITYMREGSREGTLIRPDEKKADSKGLNKSPMEVKPRPIKLAGATYRMDTPVGIAYITVNHNGGGEPMEVFLNVGKAGSDIAGMAEAIGRLISLVLRVASPLDTWERAKTVVDELKGIGGSKSLGFGDNRVRSLPDAIAKAISTHFGFKNGNGHVKEPELVSHTPLITAEHPRMDPNDSPSGLFDICPKCGVASFAYEEGCKKCYGCGYSEC